MYKLDLPIDQKEAAAIERRRNLELERQSRIFNAKVRTVGIDQQALNEQVKIRKNQEQQERERDEAFANDMVRTDKIAELLQRRQEQDIRNLNKALVDFRDVHQQPESRREWDLNDPDAKLKDKPARVSDDDPRCGLASLQRFDGEDLNDEARKNLMQEQMREWTRKQAQEKKLAQKRQEEADRIYDLHRREMDQRACDLAKAEEECRRAINEATRDYNKALDDEQKEKKRLSNEEELDNNFTEIANLINGDMLTENPDVASSAFGPHRVITDRWKGMSPEQIEEIRRIQELQRQEKKQLMEEEEQRNKEWDKQRLADARVATLMEREQERMRKALEKEQAESNARLSADQKAHMEYMDKEVYTNPPTASYFQQFNTSSR
ncbi:putative RIB43A-like with coiled-coils protein 2-like [Apostichopus japonicus]|uniref:Putative RIB43A-like with coiled-coils protein 2-like n=1 Tax=Stichopus japonicus TaxID=307972 RepID=A0A2G8L132_STIJA|nr:putative RIB43A-like with coiled-coils protein 2-like [Apostichopus japonicus]